jgi:hypothetical protein
MKEITLKEKSINEVLSSEAFSELDLCQLTIELFHDIIFHNNSDYLKKSISESGLAEKLFELLINEDFKNHPLRILLEEKNDSFVIKKIKEFITMHFREIPGFTLFVMKHDDKRATVFVTAQLYAAVGQLKSVSENCLKPWSIVVQTEVGTFNIN